MLHFSLHRKVLGAFLLLSLIPLGFLLFTSQHSLLLVEDLLRRKTTEALDTQASKALEKRAQMVARQVSAFLNEIEGDLRDLALLDRNEETYLEFCWSHQRDLWFRRGTNDKPIEVREKILLYNELAFIDASGMEQLRIVDGRPSRQYRFVADPALTTYKTEDYFHKTAALDKGNVWVSRLHGWYVSRDEQLRGAETPLEAVQGTPYRGVIRFSIPIYEDELFKGIVVLSLDHRHLMEYTQHINPIGDEDVVFPSYASANYAFMFDDQGWMIAHPKYWDIRGYDRDGRLVPAYTERTSDEDIRAGRIPFNLFEAAFIHPNYPEAAKAVLEGASGVLDTTNVGGSDKIMAFAPIHYSGGVYRDNGVFGGVTIGAEVAEFHKPAVSTSLLIKQEINDYLLQSWLVISLTIMFVVGFAYVLSNSIVRPLLLLKQGTQKMIDGVSPQVDISTNDEVGELADSFNTMVEELNHRRQRLLKTMQALRNSRKEIIRQRNFKDTVFENIETGLLTLDADYRVSSVNGSACEILQIERPSQDCSWNVVLKDWPELSLILNNWFSEKQPQSNTFRDYATLERQGKKLTYRMAMFPLSFRQQAGWLLTIEDLTERVNMRLQMSRMDRLASLGRMSAGIAHEVRNPLTGVSLLLDELHDRLLGQESDQKLIRRALGEIERLESLVNEMLRFSTMPEPKLVMASVEMVLHDSLFLLRKQCQRLKVNLVEEIESELPQLRMDVDRIKQVLLNLMNNALDAMPDGGTLNIRARLQKDSVLIEVQDSGIGISADNLPLVFEPFFTDKGQGTGLGLAISYNIISDHGGDIQLDSLPGEGTTVKVSLPLKQPGEK